jgi:hypothetical protein
MNKLFLFFGLAIVWLLAGCTAHPGNRVVENRVQPTPTYSSYFSAMSGLLTSPIPGQPAAGTPTVASFFSQHETITPLPLSPETYILATAITQTQIVSATVFDDHLNPNWSLQTAPGMQVDQANTTHAHSGNTSIAMTPYKDFSMLFFTVNHDTTVEYQRNQVIGISFWLNSGNSDVNSSDLAVAVMGSNTTPYWLANDNSATIDKKINFSETRLYYLGLNRSIPAETWVHLIVYLDNLIYDPAYKYLTGFYFKNDAGFFQTVYLDDIDVLMISDVTQPTNTVTPSVTFSPTPTVTPGPFPITSTVTLEPTAKNGLLPTLTPRPTNRPRATSTPRK